jgi:hypothetical protein
MEVRLTPMFGARRVPPWSITDILGAPLVTPTTGDTD